MEISYYDGQCVIHGEFKEIEKLLQAAMLHYKTRGVSDVLQYSKYRALLKTTAQLHETQIRDNTRTECQFAKCFLDDNAQKRSRLSAIYEKRQKAEQEHARQTLIKAGLLLNEKT